MLFLDRENPESTIQILVRVDQIVKVSLGKRNAGPSNNKETQKLNVFFELEQWAVVPIQRVLVDVDEEFVPDLQSAKVQGEYVTSGESSYFEFERFSLVGGEISGSGTDGFDEFVLSGVCNESLSMTFNKTYRKCSIPSVVYQGMIRKEKFFLVVEGTCRTCAEGAKESIIQFFMFNLPRSFGRQVVLYIFDAQEGPGRVPQ